MKKTVRAYSHLETAELASGSALVDRSVPSLPSRRSPKKSDRVDRLKTVLVIAAAFASLMVGVVAARSLLSNAERPRLNAQVGR